MTIIRAQPVIDIEDIVVVLIIEPFIVHRLARFCQDTPRVVGRLVSELRVAYAIRFDNVRRELPDWRKIHASGVHASPGRLRIDVWSQLPCTLR